MAVQVGGLPRCWGCTARSAACCQLDNVGQEIEGQGTGGFSESRFAVADCKGSKHEQVLLDSMSYCRAGEPISTSFRPRRRAPRRAGRIVVFPEPAHFHPATPTSRRIISEPKYPLEEVSGVNAGL